MLSLDGLTETEINHQCTRFILRFDRKETCARVFQVVRVAGTSTMGQISTRRPECPSLSSITAIWSAPTKL